MKKIAVLGASGATGRHLLRLAVGRGLETTAYVRDPGRLPAALADEVRVIVGSIDDVETMREAMDGADAVISVLGLTRASRSPWAPMRGRLDVVGSGIRSAVSAGAGQSSRLVLMSAFGAGASRGHLPFLARAVIASSNVRHSYADLVEAETSVVRDAPRHFIVRAVTLSDGPATGRYRTVEGRIPLSARISREDIASALLDYGGSDSSGTVTVSS